MNSLRAIFLALVIVLLFVYQIQIWANSTFAEFMEIKIIMEIKNGAYQIGTKDGIIKGWFQRPDLIKSGNSNTKIDYVLRDKSLCLRDVGKKQSITGGQGVKKCNCKAAKKRCQTAKCNCFKGNVKCGSRCHSNLDCLNKNDE